MESYKMQWDLLINDKRFGLENYRGRRRESRSDFQRDFDRLVFSSPFRRLQNKTQVFPLPGSIFVHNRLTHSLEVSCVGRSMARAVSHRLREKYAGEPWVDKFDSIDDIVAAACLAHDLGNPPFGHSGEKAISTFFSEGPGSQIRRDLSREQWADLTNFEGNANAFRLLTHQFEGRRPGGFAMTYSTLASIVKYPFQSTLANEHGKFGFFSSEKEDFCRVADELGMLQQYTSDGEVRYARHPETFLRFFEPARREEMLKVMDNVDDPNEKVGYMRSSVISRLVDSCVDAFVSNEDAILEGRAGEPLIALMNEREREAYCQAEALSYERIYETGDVIDIELAGNRIISFLMEKLIHAVRFPELNYSRLLLAKVPQQYQTAAPTLFGKIQAAIDHISGMTDVYALDLFRKLNGMSLKINN